MFDLSILPIKAQDELRDFYQFLVERYAVKKAKSKNSAKREDDINTFFNRYNVDLSNFSFNRDEIYE